MSMHYEDAIRFYQERMAYYHTLYRKKSGSTRRKRAPAANKQAKAAKRTQTQGQALDRRLKELVKFVARLERSTNQERARIKATRTRRRKSLAPSASDLRRLQAEGDRKLKALIKQVDRVTRKNREGGGRS